MDDSSEHGVSVALLAFAKHAETQQEGGQTRLKTVDDRLAIYCLDVQPLPNKMPSTRFATGGADNAVKIWSLAGHRETVAGREGGDEPTILASLSRHTGMVQCVRWSPSGDFLASGADDKVLYVWQRMAGAGGVFGEQATSVENWTCVLALEGHGSDVTGIAWSPDSRTIATCSMDNHVRIWAFADGMSAQRRGEGKLITPLETLDGHTSCVKGLSWSPDGRLIASSAEDRKVILWRVGGAATSGGDRVRVAAAGARTVIRMDEQTSTEAIVTAPYENNTAQSYFRRIDWSPNGVFLSTTNARNDKGIDACSVLTHQKDDDAPPEQPATWCELVGFVGHNKAVVCTRYSPVCFVLEERAIRSPDIPITKQVCLCAIGSEDQSITIWASHMNTPFLVLRNCFRESVIDLSWSSDGLTLLAASMDGTVLAFTLDPRELAAKVGIWVHVGAAPVGSPGRRIGSQGGSQAEAAVAENPHHLLMARRKTSAPPAPSDAVATKKLQKESLTKKGRRRIMPVAVRAVAASSESSFAFGGGESFSGGAPTAAAFASSSSAAAAAATSTASSSAAASAGAAPPSAAPRQHFGLSAAAKRKSSGAGKGGKSSDAKRRKSPSGGGTRELASRAAAPSFSSSSSSAAAAAAAMAPPPQRAVAIAAPVIALRKVLTRPVPVLYASSDGGGVRDASLGTGSGGASPKSGCLTVVQEEGGKQELLNWIELDTVLWEARLVGERITLVAGNRGFAAAATARGYLHIFSSTGRRLFPPACASRADAGLCSLLSASISRRI